MALAVLCLIGAACSSVSTQEGSRVLPETADSSESSSQPAETGANESAAPAEADSASDSSTPSTEPSGAQSSDDATSDSDRGGRNLGSDAGSLDDSEPQTQSDEAAATPTPATPEPAPSESDTSDAQTSGSEASDAETTDGVEPTETPVATTAPLPTVAPLATAAPVVAVQPTSTPIPEPVVESQVPTGPLPSDDIVVEGPTVDESLPAGISNNGASACASAESAIEFLDFGDTNRMAGALAEAAQFAGQASEPELVALAPELAAAGNDPEAAISTIIATLGACAVYGYQV